MSVSTLVIFSEEPEVAEGLQRLAEQSAAVEVLALASDESVLGIVQEKENPEFLLCDLGYAPHLVLDMLERLPEPRPISIVYGPEHESDVILRAMKLGVREFLSEGTTPDQITELIERFSAETRSAETKKETGVIAVMGAKGGVGATLAACQLAAGLQKTGGRTAIVDLNIPLGDVAVYFDVDPTYTLADIARAGKDIDATLVGELLQRHATTGVEVLAAPSRVEEAELVRAPHVQAVIEQLKMRFDWIVIDVSRSWNETSMRAIDLADHVLLLTLQDVPSLNHARAHRDVLLRLGMSARKIHTIVNRESKDVAVSNDDMTKFLGSSPESSLPNDYATAVTSVNEGRPVSDVAPGSPIDQAFQRLVSMVHTWHGVPLESSGARAGLGGRILSIFKRS
jgi:pilus assembly protein CpaE